MSFPSDSDISWVYNTKVDRALLGKFGVSYQKLSPFIQNDVMISFEVCL